MGVYGLWRLLDASGKPVPLESLEGKVLAIDISIWIYQVLQGYQDRHGNPRPNAHLLGLFTRICKLLYYRIKPVFVFDGGVPMLKRNTIASRRKQKSIATSKAQKMKADLISNLIKHSMVKTVLHKDTETDKNNATAQITINLQTKRPEQDMFALPDMPNVSNVQAYVSDDEYDSDMSESVELSPRKQSKWMGNIHNVDVTTNEFKALPADVRYDILTDLRETRKQNSWGRLYEMPEESQEFSGFQMRRLLKRRYVQESLESAEKEMGGKTMTLEQLEKLMSEQGVDTKSRDTAFRIAADSTTRLIYISDKNALAKNSDNKESETNKNDTLQNAEEIEPVAGPSNPTPIIENMSEYALDDDSDNDADVSIYDDSLSIIENINECTFDSDREAEIDINESQSLAKKYFGTNNMNPVLTYMLEYSGLSQKEIMHLIKHSTDESRNTKNKSAKTSGKDICLNLTENKDSTCNKSVIQFPVENYEEISKPVELQNTQDTCIAKRNTANEIIPSSSKFDDLVEVEPLKNNIEISTFTVATSTTNSHNEITSEECSVFAVKSDNVTQIDTSDSDSDDFIEIQDVPIPDVDVRPKTITKKENIEITIKSDGKLEDDMFAEIFENADKNEVTSTNYSKQYATVQSISANDEHQTTLISEDYRNSKRHLLGTTSAEPIIEKTNIESLENIQLTENVPRNEDKVCDSVDSDGLTDRHNTKTHTEDNSVKENIKERAIILPTNEEDLIGLKDQLEDEQDELAKGIGKLERQATNISDQIRIEAQELLRLFGIPYIMAPMEAEAQCAYLEQIKLTDGTITDDSDIWLFGGQCVYKNFFNNKKKVLQFHACDIQHHFKLTRNQLIQLALLVGSDYTTGIDGIGPVTALEILAAFPAEGDNVLHGLHNFCSWIKKGRIAIPGKTSLRNKLRNVKLNRDFPSQAVVQAYLFPTVDESKETFTWGKLNAVLLCDYTRIKFGWTKGKFDDTMIPVLRRLEENKHQKLLDVYFKMKTSTKSVEPSLSKRVQKALHKLNSVDNADEENVDGEPQNKNSKKDVARCRKMKKEEKTVESDASIPESKISASSTIDMSAKPVIQCESTKEYIPQREKDKANALEKKLHAIEIFRKSKQGLGRTKKMKRTVRKVKKEAELSESDSN